MNNNQNNEPAVKCTDPGAGAVTPMDGITPAQLYSAVSAKLPFANAVN